MKLALFIYNFAKIYIPAALLLCAFYVATHDVERLREQALEPQQTIRPKENIPQLQPPPVSLPQSYSRATPHQRNPTPQPQPQPQPQLESNPIVPSVPNSPSTTTTKYYYVVELASGKFMKIDRIIDNNDMLTMIVDKGFSIQLPKREIKSIKRYHL